MKSCKEWSMMRSSVTGKMRALEVLFNTHVQGINFVP